MSEVTSSNVLLKQSAESRLFKFVFRSLLDVDRGELLFGTPTVTSSPTGLTITGIAIATDGFAVQMRVADGVDSERYRIECLCNTTFSNRLEVDGLLDVKDE